MRCYTPRRSRWEPMDSYGKAFGYFALFSEIGLVLLVTTLGGALAGYWLDEQVGTKPLFVVLGFLVGASLGATADWRLISRFLERLDD
jgi:ATP synthase protein I